MRRIEDKEREIEIKQKRHDTCCYEDHAILIEQENIGKEKSIEHQLVPDRPGTRSDIIGPVNKTEQAGNIQEQRGQPG